MQDKFKLNRDYYILEKKKFIYIKNQVRQKTIYHLEPLFLILFYHFIDHHQKLI